MIEAFFASKLVDNSLQDDTTVRWLEALGIPTAEITEYPQFILGWFGALEDICKRAPIKRNHDEALMKVVLVRLAEDRQLEDAPAHAMWSAQHPCHTYALGRHERQGAPQACAIGWPEEDDHDIALEQEPAKPTVEKAGDIVLVNTALAATPGESESLGKCQHTVSLSVVWVSELW